MPEPWSPLPCHLVSLVGLSPQVVTETLWLLAADGAHALPKEVTVLTTGEGAELAAARLPAAVSALAALLGHPLPPPRIVVMRDRSGQALPDIRDDADNRAAADSIVGLIREATADAGTRLHLSIAGGRKTMSCLGALALSLFGRPEDLLSHVLVAEAYQAREDFFFPPEPPKAGAVGAGERWGLSLAEVPFVRLRGLWHPDQLAGGFAEAVRAAQAAMAPRLALDLARGRAVCGGTAVRLAPALLATLLVFAERAQQGAAPLVPAKAGDARTTAVFASAHARCRAAAKAARPATGPAPIGRPEVAERVSRLNARLRAALGPDSAPYEVRPQGRRPRTGYRLALAPEAITIIGGNA
jgi:CRISPR-associated protein (TIGR02584 family)